MADNRCHNLTVFYLLNTVQNVGIVVTSAQRIG
jgi:hypothetical protein